MSARFDLPRNVSTVRRQPCFAINAPVVSVNLPRATSAAEISSAVLFLGLDAPVSLAAVGWTVDAVASQGGASNSQGEP